MNRLRAGQTLGVALLLSLPACSDLTTSPPSPRQAAAMLAPLGGRLGRAGIVQQGQLTVYAPDGAYTLDFANSSLRMPNNIVITEIPIETMETFATAFQHQIDDLGGQAEAFLAANPPPDDGTGGCKDGSQCALLRADPGPFGASPPTPRGAVPDPRETRKGHGIHNKQLRATPPSASRVDRRAGRARTGVASDLALMPLPRFAAVTGPFTCVDAAKNLYYRIHGWYAAKDTAQVRLRDLKKVAAEYLLGPEWGLDDVLTGPIELRFFALYQWLKDVKGEFDYYTANARYELANAEVASAWSQLDLAVMFYNELGCSNPNSGNWTPESFGQTMPGPSIMGGSGSYGWICHDDLVFDADGFGKIVTTCQYIFAA